MATFLTWIGFLSTDSVFHSADCYVHWDNVIVISSYIIKIDLTGWRAHRCLSELTLSFFLKEMLMKMCWIKLQSERLEDISEAMERTQHQQHLMKQQPSEWWKLQKSSLVCFYWNAWVFAYGCVNRTYTGNKQPFAFQLYWLKIT